jgi:hypothetical protein
MRVQGRCGDEMSARTTAQGRGIGRGDGQRDLKERTGSDLLKAVGSREEASTQRKREIGHLIAWL